MRANSKGFTLIEMIMVIVIIGFLSVIATDIITLPVKSYMDLGRRATLVDIAETSMRRIQRDIRKALPNSIRITGSGKVMELLHTVDGGRYRAAGTGNRLDFTLADSSFDVIGVLQNFSAVDTTNDQLVIYNLGPGSSQADAYQSVNNNRSTLSNSSTSSSIAFSSKNFPYQSPQQRFFIVDTPVTYLCDTVNQQLLRYAGYSIAATQPNPPGVAGKLLANKVAACTFTYTPGTSSRASLLTMELIITDSASESVRLIHQVHVDNVS